MEINYSSSLAVNKEQTGYKPVVAAIPTAKASEKTISRDRVTVDVARDNNINIPVTFSGNEITGVKPLPTPDSMLKKMSLPEAEALSLTSNVLSLVPGADVVKLSINVLSTRARSERLEEEETQKDPYLKYNNTVNMVKSGWGAVVSGSKVTTSLASEAKSLGFIGQKTVDKVTKNATRINMAASMVTLPFSIAGTSIYGWSLSKESEKLEDKELELMLLDNNKVISSLKGYNKDDIDKSKKELEANIADIKVNRRYKTSAFTFSVISTSSLAVAAVSPRFSATAATVSLFSSVGASISSTFSDDKNRKRIHDNFSKNKHLLLPFYNQIKK